MNRPAARKLREHPNLPQLKRQAKELLAAFIAAEPEAEAEVNAHYPGADRTTFALHDAQLVLARSYGFDSWPKLKAYVDGVTLRHFVEAIERGNGTQVRAMLKVRPELINMDMAENDEHRPLHFAVLARSAPMVRLLMEHGADARKGIYPHRVATGPLTLARERGYDEIVAIIEEEEQRRRSPQVTEAIDELIEAIWNREESRFMPLLESRPELVTARDRRGWTPLHMAAATLNEPLVAWLLEHGADVNLPGPQGRTPLDVADGTGWRKAGGLEKYPAIAERLRRHGAALTPRSAVALGEAEWVRAKHSEGALANSISGPGGLLSVAVRHDRPEMLALLLDLGLDPDERTRVNDVEEVVPSWGMPLHHCAGLGKLAMAEMLLQRGTDPNGNVYAGGSVMYSALSAGNRQMAELLERYGGITSADTIGHLRLTDKARKMLEDRDAGRLQPGSFHRALEPELLWAGIRGGDPEIVRMTLERIDWPRDDQRWHGMLWSSLPRGERRSEEEQARNLACFRQILERCDPNVLHRSEERTVLHDVAALDEDATDLEVLTFATLLLDAGIKTGRRDKTLKSTPLGWACRWGRAGLVKLLLERGADPVEHDAEPWATPKAWAKRMGHHDVLALLP